MKKYPISDEFKSVSNLVVPINRTFLRMAQKRAKPPESFFTDKELEVQSLKIHGYKGKEITVYVISPREVSEPLPCVIDYHGGGFVLEGMDYHYHLAMIYAKRLHCKVIFPCYRLAPKYPFPFPIGDCYITMKYIYANAEMLGIDSARIGFIGDSAGGTLATAVCLPARDGKHSIRPKFQALLYPFLDARNNSASARKFTDTPIWNSKRSIKVGPLINPGMKVTDKRMLSPVEVEDLSGLPPTYIETAEFDCLHDDGILYAGRLEAAGVPVEINETKGTIHAFDIVLDCDTTKNAVERRIAFMRTWL